MKTCKIKFRLTPEAIIDGKIKIFHNKSQTGNIYWMLHTLKNIYNIEISITKARKLAKEKAIVAVKFSKTKSPCLNWQSVNKHNLPKLLTQQDEACVKIEQLSKPFFLNY